MREINLRQVDLNLLTALDALLQHGSVTLAGRQLGLSQPATSRALARLRDLLGDPLLVSSGRAMLPTPRALRLREPVRRLLDDVRSVIHQPEFEPASVDGCFRINAPDATTIVVLSRVFAEVAREAPGLDFEVTSTTAGRIEAMSSGELDFAIDAFPRLPSHFERRRLIWDRLVCVCRRGHPAAAKGLSSAAYGSWPHVTIDAAAHDILEAALKRQGIHRRHSFKTTNFIAAASIVAGTDWLLTLPSNLARRVATMLPLDIVDLPFEAPKLSLDLVWHERLDRDPAHRWLRSRIVAITEASFPPDLDAARKAPAKPRRQPDVRRG